MSTKATVAWIILWSVCAITFYGTLGLVIAHFIAKFW